MKGCLFILDGMVGVLGGYIRSEMKYRRAQREMGTPLSLSAAKEQILYKLPDWVVKKL
jgi:hypothetical protein